MNRELKKKPKRSTSPVHIHLTDDIPIHVHVKKPVRRITAMNKKNPNAEINNLHSKEIISKVGQSSSVPRNKSGIYVSQLSKGGLSGSSDSRQRQSRVVSFKNMVGEREQNNNNSKLTESTKYLMHSVEKPPAPPTSDHSSIKSPTTTVQPQESSKQIDSNDGKDDNKTSEMQLEELEEVNRSKNEMLESSRRLLKLQEEELDRYRRHLEASHRENRELKYDMEDICDTIEKTNDLKAFPNSLVNEVVIMKKYESGIDKIIHLRHFLENLLSKMDEYHATLNLAKSSGDVDLISLTMKKQSLEREMEHFAVVDGSILEVLKQKDEQMRALDAVSLQRDQLLNKFAHLQETHQILKQDLKANEEKCLLMESQLKGKNTDTTEIMQSMLTMKTAKAHLQNQLRSKDSECERLTIRLKNIEKKLDDERSEFERLKSDIKNSKYKGSAEREDLKKAAKLQKKRAEQLESMVGEMRRDLADNMMQLDDTIKENNNLRLQLGRVSREKLTLKCELDDYMGKLEDLEKIINDFKKVKSVTENEAEELMGNKGVNTNNNNNNNNNIEKLEIIKLEEECQKLKNSLVDKEMKTEEYKQEVAQLKTRLAISENSLEDKKIKLDKLIGEIGQLKEKIDQKETEAVLEKSKNYLELQKSLLENSKMGFTDNDGKNDNLTTMQNSRKLEILEEKNKELIKSEAKKEEALKQTILRLDEKSSEIASLHKQLDASQSDLRHAKEEERDRYAGMERAIKMRIVDLEALLNQARKDYIKIKREKEEVERKLNCRIFDLNEKLEQSCSTNRTLQNYVQFLKNSYATAFNDTSLSSAFNSSIPSIIPKGSYY